MIAKTLATTLSTDKKREQLLNKFLTKTFYMITECDPSVASWSSDGNSFTVRDIKRFESVGDQKKFYLLNGLVDERLSLVRVQFLCLSHSRLTCSLLCCLSSLPGRR